MEISEKSIEDLIINSIQSGNIEQLHNRGLYGVSQYHKFLRQLNLGPYGILDIVGIKYYHSDQSLGCVKRFRVGVVEIKKGEINSKTFLQALRYCKGIEKLLEEYNMCATFDICLIGSSVSTDDFIYATDFVENLSIYTIKLDLEHGITFNSEHGYSLTDYKKPLVSEIVMADLKDYVKGQIRKSIFQKYIF